MNSSERARVLIGDDRSSFPTGVCAMLPSEFDVVGSVHDSGSLLAESLRLEPDLVLLDAAMAFHDGFGAAKEIMRRLPRTKVVILTISAQEPFGKDTGKRSRELRQAIRLATAADHHAPAARARQSPTQATAEFAGTDSAELTHREREILTLLASGLAMKAIAYRLGITYRTVAFHKYRMMGRLGIKTNAGLTTYALQTGALAMGAIGHTGHAAKRIAAA